MAAACWWPHQYFDWQIFLVNMAIQGAKLLQGQATFLAVNILAHALSMEAISY
jgi:hypothetical protein